MNFTNWMGLWTVIMPLAVIVYYFFRKKYIDRQVSSILFWQETMKEIQASPYLKKLQRHLLFYIQLVALLLCVLALMGPNLNTETLKGNEFIFVIDTSASMLAGSPSQFDLQKENMLALVEQASGKPVTIVRTGGSPEVLIRGERDTKQLVKTVENLEVTFESAEMEQALLFAESLAMDETTVIHVFTDALDRKLLASKSGQAFVVHGMERELENASIRQFGLAKGENGLRAIVQIENAGTEKLTGEVVVSADSGNEKRQSIEVDPGAELIVPFEGLSGADLWHAELKVADDYQADNEMAAYLQQEQGKVFIDSSLHKLVASGFGSLKMDAITVEPEGIFKQTGAPIVTNQTALLEGFEPVLLLGRNDEQAEEVSGKIETTSHPLFTYALLDDVYVSKLYPGFEGFETVASIDGKPFIQLSPEGDIAVLTDVQSTDWPLHPSFPLFLWSAVQNLTASNDFLGFFQPNEYRSVALASSSREWEIFKENVYSHSYIEGQGALKAPMEPGIYDVVGEVKTLKMIVRLSNEEKVLAKGSSYEVGAAKVEDETVKYSMLPWIISVILLLLLMEWEVYRRGIANR